MSIVQTPKDELAMSWLNLTYEVSGLFGRQRKAILTSLDGQINFHTLTGLMGPSGSGKSTLLKCITMRDTEGMTADTEIYINKQINLRTCLIMKNSSDHLLMGLTARLAGVGNDCFRCN